MYKQRSTKHYTYAISLPSDQGFRRFSIFSLKLVLQSFLCVVQNIMNSSHGQGTWGKSLQDRKYMMQLDDEYIFNIK
jgi:hypothetical protein